MSPEEIRKLAESSEKTITTPVHKATFRIRKLGVHELQAAKAGYVLGLPEQSKMVPGGTVRINAAGEIEDTRTLAERALTDLAALEGMRAMLATTDPAIVFCKEKRQAVPEGSVDASWIAKDIDWIAEQIVEFSGFNPVDEKAVEDLIKNELTPV